MDLWRSFIYIWKQYKNILYMHVDDNLCIFIFSAASKIDWERQLCMS